MNLQCNLEAYRYIKTHDLDKLASVHFHTRALIEELKNDLGDLEFLSTTGAILCKFRKNIVQRYWHKE